MAPSDAQLLWLSAKVPNDQFLVYVFEGEPDVRSGVDAIRRNAEGCAELRLRVLDDTPWRYPRWVRSDVGEEQVVVHETVGQWRTALESVAGLEQLDVSRIAWRVHVFPPGVVVVQISHALGDGARSAALAATLLGRRVPIPAVRPRPGNLLLRSIEAARAHRQMSVEIEAGLLPRPAPPRPALSVNAAPRGTPVLQTLVVDRSRLSGPTVTVAALSAISEALGGYLVARGEDVGMLGAEVPMAGPPSTQARNNFRNVSVGLYPELDRDGRARRIAADLAAQRRRVEHRATRASDEAFAAVPAPVLRWGVGRFDAGARSSTVSGHTVVSSVNRGPADLTFGGRRVLLTTGYPALSPMMRLTHGVHGIGETIAISLHADSAVVDVDEYADRLARALG